MTLLKKIACAAAVAVSFAGSASANTVMNDWVFNPVGGGFANGQSVNEYLDVNGNGFIQLTPTGGSSFSFTEHAVFNIGQADGNGQFFPLNYTGGNITATFAATGTGNFSGAFRFTSGTINMYQNPTNGQYGSTAGVYGANLGSLIASFNVLAGGGGTVDASGSPTNNGQVSVRAEAAVGGLKAGYFFDEDGNDLSAQSVLAFAFTNANTVGNPNGTAVKNLVGEVACQFAGFTGPGCSGGTYANTPNYFFVSNNGQFKLAEVPEPGSLALFGIAMLGAGIFSRKRAKQA